MAGTLQLQRQKKMYATASHFLDLQDNSGGEEAINVSGLNYVAKLDKERSGFLYKFPPHTSIGKFLVTDIWIGN